MSKDVMSKIRAGDVWKHMKRVLDEYRVTEFEVVDCRPHPKVVIRYAGVTRDFHFAGTPSSRNTATVTAQKLRRVLQGMQMEGLPGGASSPAEITVAEPTVTMRDGVAYTSTRDVAAAFGKEHRHVMEEVRRLLESLSAEKSAVWFKPMTFQAKVGFGTRSFEAFDMTREGFTLLAMGFTGERALEFKVAYIDRFNAMEREIERLRGGGEIALSSDVLSRFGGVVKSIVMKHLSELRQEVARDLAAASVAPTYDLAGTVTAYEIIEMAGIDGAERVRGTAMVVTPAMKDFCLRLGQRAEQTPKHIDPSQRWRFPRAAAQEWLFGASMGAEIIRRQIERMQQRRGHGGQGRLALVAPVGA